MMMKTLMVLTAVLLHCDCLEANLEVAWSTTDQDCVCKAPENCIAAEWNSWSSCSVSCGTEGVRARVAPQRPALEEKGGGRCPPRVEQQACTQLAPCRVDCRVSEWGPWSACAATCSGESSRQRTVIGEPSGGGGACPSLYDVRRCPGSVECSMDCRTTSWSDWSCCAGTALGRLKTRDRLVTVKQAGSGADCPTLRGFADCNEITFSGNARAGCADDTNDCDEWMKDGHCTRNAGYMLKSCRKSCRVCTDSSTSVPTPQPDRCILVVGGHGKVPAVEFYHPTEGVQCNVSDVQMSVERIKGETQYTSGCYLSESNRIVIREGQNPDKPAMVYELSDGSTKQLPLPYTSGKNSYFTAHSTAAAVTAHQCLSCGGRDLDAKLWLYNNCYEYDARNADPRWRPIAPLPHAGLGSAASVALGDNFYVIGGWNGSEPAIKDLYRYNVPSRKWHREKSMSKSRRNFAAARLSTTEFIVCGGNRASSEYPSSDCERYNETERRWLPAGSLNTGQHDFAMVEFDGDVYIIGGVNRYGNPDNTVEMYDRLTNRWRFVKKLKHVRKRHLAFVV